MKNGAVLRCVVDSELYAAGNKRDIPFLTAGAVLEKGGGLSILAVNRSTDRPMDLRLDYPSISAFNNNVWYSIGHDDRQAVNSALHPEMVVPRKMEGLELAGDHAGLQLPPCSWNLVRFHG